MVGGQIEPPNVPKLPIPTTLIVSITFIEHDPSDICRRPIIPGLG